MRVSFPLFLLVVVGIAGCPKPLEGVERLEVRRFEIPEREHETVARVQAMERSIKAMQNAMLMEGEDACTSDDDCSVTYQHCCNCQSGGQRVGVRRDKNLFLAQRRMDVCRKVVCNQEMSDHPTCGDVIARCLEGRCVADPVVAAMPEVPTEPIPDEPTP